MAHGWSTQQKFLVPEKPGRNNIVVWGREIVWLYFQGEVAKRALCPLAEQELALVLAVRNQIVKMTAQAECHWYSITERVTFYYYSICQSRGSNSLL